MAGSINNTGTYRVTIDISKICENVYAAEGGKLSDLAVRNWLRSAGFRYEPENDTWVAAEENMRLLDKSEIVHAERVVDVECAAATV